MAAGQIDGNVNVLPWYATVFRADRFEQAMNIIAPVALRYGALEYEVLRSLDDSYMFQQITIWEEQSDFYAYWEGPEFIDFRVRYSSWFQVPVVYSWQRRIASGSLIAEAEERAFAIDRPEAAE